MKKITCLAAAACAALLPSCLQHETTITLQKDGGGTLVEETRFGAQAVAMMGQFGGGEEGKDPFKEMFSEDKAKARATALGEGVTFEKSEPVTLNGGKGAKVTYRFKDINKLKLNPSDGMSNLAPEGTPKPETPKEEPIKFSFSSGQLTIEMPRPKETGKPAGEKPVSMEEDNPQAEAMAKQMMGDMKMSVKLVFSDGIGETNATHRDGNTITLMEMDMGKILNQPGAFKKLQSAPEGDTAAAMEIMKGIDGMKMEIKEKVTVDLKK